MAGFLDRLDKRFNIGVFGFKSIDTERAVRLSVQPLGLGINVGKVVFPGVRKDGTPGLFVRLERKAPLSIETSNVNFSVEDLETMAGLLGYRLAKDAGEGEEEQKSYWGQTKE